MSGRRDTALAATLFAGLMILYHLNGDFLPGHDAVPNVHLPFQMLRHGRLTYTVDDAPFMFTWWLTTRGQQRDVRLDLAPHELARRDAAWRTLRRQGLLALRAPDYYLIPSVEVERRGYVNIYGPGAGLAALPVFALQSLFVGPVDASTATLWYAGKLVASLCVAASAALVFLTSRRFVGVGDALAVALAYGAATCVWSVSSQALWQSTPVLLLLALAAYLSLDARLRTGRAAACGLAAGCAVACRPTAVVVLITIGVHLLMAVVRRGRDVSDGTAAQSARSVLFYALGAFAVLGPLAWYNWYFLGSPLAFGQNLAGGEVARAKLGLSDPWAGSFREGLAGQLLSPSRGLLVYSPILLVSLLGIPRLWREPRFGALRPFGIAAVIIILVQSKWFYWHGGHSFGYRLLVDVVPLLVLSALPLVPAARRRPLLAIPLAAALVWSIAVQVVGAYAYDIIGWNMRPAFLVERPGEAEPLRVLDQQEAHRLAENAGRVQGIPMDVDMKEFRYRLWSVGDSQLAYYAAHFAESRRRKHRIMANWLRSYQINANEPRTR